MDENRAIHVKQHLCNKTLWPQVRKWFPSLAGRNSVYYQFLHLFLDIFNGLTGIYNLHPEMVTPHWSSVYKWLTEICKATQKNRRLSFLMEDLTTSSTVGILLLLALPRSIHITTKPTTNIKRFSSVFQSFFFSLPSISFSQDFIIRNNDSVIDKKSLCSWRD